MKVVLSRKGFDNQYGGQPSPIMPDGTLLSFPIPAKNEKVKFSDIYYDGKSYLDIIKELNKSPQIKDDYACHLDPDIRFINERNIKNWRPLFGQASSALGHLDKQEVGIGDVFLFFGSFRKTEIHNNKLQYIKTDQEVHLIYAFLQVGKIYRNTFPDCILYHSHTAENFNNNTNNAIFESAERLSFINGVKGADNLKFHKKLVLTKSGYSKSKWELPDIFKDLNISYHTEKSFKGDYFQSAAKGQEFVISDGDKLIPWMTEMIKYIP